ncbi:MAG: ABC transporter permease [Candidatus Methanomethylophilaceae archaeon]|jgi:multidrug/hemolysin transport system permease protein
MIGFAKRNMLIFFRDRSTVFFSFLGVFIVLALYILFLGDIWEGDLSQQGITNSKLLIGTWMMAGVIAIASVTISMGAFGTMVEDRDKNIVKDFRTSPVKRRDLVAGYVLSVLIIGILMTVITFIVALAYLMCIGYTFPSILTILEIFGIIILSVLANSTMILFIVSLIKTTSAFSTASAIVGTLIGFLAGVYIPVGALPSGVATIVNIFPTSHAASLLRTLMMKDITAASFSDLPPEAITEFNNSMGVTLNIGGVAITPFESIFILLGYTVVFFVLAVMVLSRKNEQ